MSEGPSEGVVFEAPRETRRSPLEVMLLFVGLIVVLYAFWIVRAPLRGGPERGLTSAMLAEQMAQGALASSPAMPGQPLPGNPLWQQARRRYGAALRKNPRLLPARLGLAAMDYVEGNRTAARETVAHPVDVPAGKSVVWRAVQSAFGAQPKPRAPAERARYVAALRDKELGWPRYVALEALSPDKAQAARWQARLHAEASQRRGGGWLAGIGVLLLLVGTGVLGWILAHPLPNRLPRIPAPTAALVWAFVTALVLYQVPMIAAEVWMKGTSALWTMAVGQAAGAVLMFLVVSGMLRGAGASLRSFGWRVRDALPFAIGGYLAMLPLLAVSTILVLILVLLMPDVETPMNPAAGFATGARGWQVLLVFLVASVVGPIVEEFLFRGLLFRGLQKRYGVVVGALASSLVFGGLHPQLPLGFPPIFVIGVVLCYLYRSSGSLVPSILVHGVSNGLVLLLVRGSMR